MWANTEYSPEGYRVSIYRTCTPHMEERRERGQRLNPISCVLCVSSVVLMGRDTGLLQLLAPLLLTGGNGVDLVIRGDVVLNRKFQASCGLRRLPDQGRLGSRGHAEWTAAILWALAGAQVVMFATRHGSDKVRPSLSPVRRARLENWIVYDRFMDLFL
jgi:hypothetical protein